MISKEWIEEQMAYLTSGLGVYKLGAGENFFFEPTPGFYGFIAQGVTEALNEAMRTLAEHIGSLSVPIIEDWNGPPNPLVTQEHDWASDEEPPGLIRYEGPHRSRIQIAITNKHSPLVMGAILAHELTHHFLANRGVSCPDVEENERLTDLATGYLGLGKLTLNGYAPITWTIRRGAQKTTYTYRVGYLSCKEMAAVVERVCAFRHVPIEIAQGNLYGDALRLLEEARASALAYEKKQQARIARQERRRARRKRISLTLRRVVPWFYRQRQTREEPGESRGDSPQEGMVLTCGNCGQKMRVPIEDQDLRVKCPSCKREFILHSTRGTRSR